MEINIYAHNIAPIPYISHVYGDLLAHERRIAQWYGHNVNRVHLDITIVSHNKKADCIKYKPKYELSLKP
jgi:hypothetical protein